MTILRYIVFFHRNLSSKNLPAAIEDTSGQQLPDSIREKSEKLKAIGGMSALEEKIYSLPELLTRNREILDEVRIQQMFILCTIYSTCVHFPHPNENSVFMYVFIHVNVSFLTRTCNYACSVLLYYYCHSCNEYVVKFFFIDTAIT